MVSLYDKDCSPVVTIHDLKAFVGEWLTVVGVKEHYDSNKVVVFVSENDPELFKQVLEELDGRTPMCVRVEIAYQSTSGPYR